MRIDNDQLKLNTMHMPVTPIHNNMCIYMALLAMSDPGIKRWCGSGNISCPDYIINYTYSLFMMHL